MTSSIQSETSWNFLFYCFPENLDNLYQGTQIFHPPSTGVGKKFQKTFSPRTHLTVGWGKKFKKTFYLQTRLPLIPCLLQG